MPNKTFDFTTGVLDPGFTFSRTTVGYYFNSVGVLTQAAINVPRIPAYDPATLAPLGIVIEAAVTNSVGNNTMQGAAAGSPGTQPNLWTMVGDGNGLLRTIVGTGQEDGIDYIDVRYVGTPIATGVISVEYMLQTALGGTSAQTFTWSCFYRLMAGSIANCIFNECLTASDTVVILGDNTVPFVPTNLPLRTQRIFGSGTLSAFPALTRVLTRLRVDVTVGLPVDFTLRIGLPQMGGGANLSHPVRTTIAPIAIQPDLLTMTGAPFTAWFNPVEGTFIIDFIGSNTANVYELTISDGTATNDMRILGGLVGTIYQVSTTSVIQASISVTVPGRSPFNRLLAAAAYKDNDFNLATNGILGLRDIIGTVPPGSNKMNVGSASNNAGQGYGAIKKITYQDVRVPDETLQILSSDPQLWVGGILVSDKPAIRIVKV